jgi:hypothetical protein
LHNVVVRYLHTKCIENCDNPFFQGRKATHQTLVHTPHSRRTHIKTQWMIATCYVKSQNKNQKKITPTWRRILPVWYSFELMCFAPRIFLPGHPGRAGWSQTS